MSTGKSVHSSPVAGAHKSNTLFSAQSPSSKKQGLREISKPLAKRLRLPHKALLLMRTEARPDKRILNLEERRESVRGAFATRAGSQVDNLRVLRIDDVRTTGATLEACARALLEAGAKSVVGLTVARAIRNPLPSSVEW